MTDPATTPEVKPGYKTTEFYLSTAATVLGLIFAAGIIPSAGPWAQIAGLAASVLGALGYSVSRGLAKSG